MSNRLEDCYGSGFALDPDLIELAERDLWYGPGGRLAHDHCHAILFCEPFQARAKIHGVAHDGVGHSEFRAHVAHVHLSGRNTDTDLQRGPAARLELRLKRQGLAIFTDKTIQESSRQGIRARIRLGEESIQAYSQQNEAFAQQMHLTENLEFKRSSNFRADIAENQLAINTRLNENIRLKKEFELFDLELANKMGNLQQEIEGLEISISLIENHLSAQIVLEKENLKTLEQQLKNRASRALIISELSAKPVGWTPTKSIAIVIVLSVMGAFLITLAAIFRQKVREKLAAGD